MRQMSLLDKQKAKIKKKRVGFLVDIRELIAQLSIPGTICSCIVPVYTLTNNLRKQCPFHTAFLCKRYCEIFVASLFLAKY